MSARTSVLVADGERSARMLSRDILTRAGHGVVEVADGQAAIEELGARPFDVIVADSRMPLADGFEVLRRARQVQPRTPLILLTAQGAIRDCVEATRAGAYDFLMKPFHPRDLLEMVAHACRMRGPEGKAALPDASEEGRPQVALIGGSDAIRGVIDLLERLAHTNSTVLIIGETGTGKEVVARLLSGSSTRSAGPFVAVNCAAVPESLIEAELFGHVKGAFPGAHEARTGRFVEAHGGTLFLDEIDALPLALQPRLLRVLQEREVTPIGAAHARPVDVRLVAATNVDLETEARSGRFREDLYYRLEVLPIQLPPLRERAADIVPLARHLLDAATRRLGATVEIAEEALALMKLYQWPGNVREMENVFERLVILNRSGTITSDELPKRMQAQRPGAAETASATTALAHGAIDLAATLASIEGSLIEQALRQAEGNRTRAAELLGLSRTTFVDKLSRR